jgi:hypothetical protein
MNPIHSNASLAIKEEFIKIPETFFVDSENLRSLYGNY